MTINIGLRGTSFFPHLTYPCKVSGLSVLILVLVVHTLQYRAFIPELFLCKTFSEKEQLLKIGGVVL